MTIDAALAKHFESLAGSINVKAIALKEDIDDVENTMDIKPAKPAIKFHNDSLYISGASKQQVLQIASGLQRKFSDIDLDSIERKLQEGNGLINDNLAIDFSVGNYLYLRAIAKIAVNYYLMKVRGSQYLRTIIDVINGVEAAPDYIRDYFVPAGLINNNEIAHIISVKGSASSKQLYAHIILFNTYSYKVALCNNYDGEAVDLLYRYDVPK
ncbi:MAG: hypothetical protein EOO43_06370 [Flavobacterium sp.]|nr:MAG: hypothetical protein EOO43_06370 [Flavobacterium sp.]